MKEVIFLVFHLLTGLAKLLRPGGSKTIIAGNLLLKQQMIIHSGARERAPSEVIKAIVEMKQLNFGTTGVARATLRLKNDNYSWFASRYAKFVYVDRVIISKPFAGLKIGSALYADLFSFARCHGASVVACEYNLDPPNRPSEALGAF